MSGSLVQDLRYLIAAHSLKGVHEALQELMAEEYAFLSSVFHKEAPAPLMENVMVEAEVAAPAPLNQKKLKVTVKKAAETPAPAPASTQESVVVAEPAVTQEEECVEPVRPEIQHTPQEMKKYQKEAEAKKHAELVAQGIDFRTILTKENLKKWLEDEERTYSWVAREKAGCPDTQVAAIAKSFQIQNKNTKKRAMMMARK